MPETSTTTEDNSNNSDATSTTTTTPPVPDTKPAGDSDNLDASNSDATTGADDDKKSTTTTSTTDAPASLDSDLDDWAEKRKMPKAETDEQRQAYQDLRNSQREFSRSRQEDQAAKDAKDLSKEVDDAKKGIKSEDDDDDLDPLEKRVNDVDAQLKSERETRLQSEFYTNEKVKPEEHKMLLDVMKEKFNRPTTPEGKKRAIETWSDPGMLPDLLDIARGRIAKTVDSSAITDEAARKERERIAKESQANSPGRSATTSSTSDKSEDQARLDRFKARYNKS
jgi:hypothetical protein